MQTSKVKWFVESEIAQQSRTKQPCTKRKQHQIAHRSDKVLSYKKFFSIMQKIQTQYRNHKSKTTQQYNDHTIQSASRLRRKNTWLKKHLWRHHQPYTHSKKPQAQEGLISLWYYQDVSEIFGCLPGMLHLKTTGTVSPIQHLLHKVHIALEGNNGSNRMNG